MVDFQALGASASSQFGVVTPAQLKAAGLRPKQIAYQVAQGRLRRLPGGLVALAGSPETWHQRCAAAALAAQPLGGASHRSAARLWNMRTVDTDIDVVVRYPRRLAVPGGIVHRSRDLIENDLTWVNGIPTTTKERTICDLGLIFPETEVMRILRHGVAAGDSDGGVTRADILKLRIRIGRQGRNGAGVIGRCLENLPEAAEQTESGVEVLFLNVCERFGLPTPATQLPVVIDRQNYRLDFAYSQQRIAIEIDGRASHSLPHQIAADGGRQNALVGAGWRPIRFTYEDLQRDPARCVRDLRQLLNL